MAQVIVPLMIERNYGRVVNVSSGAGGPIAEMNGKNVGYRFSKVSLNALVIFNF